MKKTILSILTITTIFALTGCDIPGFSKKNDYKFSNIDSGDSGELTKLGYAKLLGVIAPPVSEKDHLSDYANSCTNGDTDILQEMGNISKEKFEDAVYSYDYYINPFTLTQEGAEDQMFIKVYKSSDYNSETVGLDMVKDGYAVPRYCILPSKEYQEKLADAVKYAKTNKKGLWKDYYDTMSCLETQAMKNSSSDE